MIIAARTNPLVLRQLDFVDDFAAAGHFCQSPCGISRFLRLCVLSAGFLKMAMAYARAAVAA